MSKILVKSISILIEISAFLFNFDFIEIKQINENLQIFDSFLFLNDVIVDEKTKYRRFKMIKDKVKRIKK